MRILFWDIDGTLLRTAKASLYAFEQVFQETYNNPFDFSTIKTAGMTDYYIAQQVIKLATGRVPTVREICAILTRYEEVLPLHLAARQGHLMPSVTDILTYLHHREEYVSLILTGNTLIGAKAKLTHYGLENFFNFQRSAFCHNSLDRTEISVQALSIVQKYYPTVPSEHIYIIGDTPHDIHCGKFIRVRTIAVATGTYSVQELRTHSPWWVVPVLPSPMKFVKKINL